MSRTNKKWTRAYIGGVDVSGTLTEVGNLGYSFASSPDAALSDACKNIVNGQASIVADAFNGFLSPSATTGLHELMSSGTGTYVYTVAWGVQAEPVNGDIIFSYPFEQAQYQATTGEGFNMVNVAWGGPTSTNSLIASGYASPFGRIIHAKGTETAVNTATGIDDNGGSSTLGGILIYHLFSSNGTVTLKAQHASTNSNGSFADATGATSGSIDASVSPKSGMVATSGSLTINQFLRWQLVFGTASTATFMLGFIRRLWA